MTTPPSQRPAQSSFRRWLTLALTLHAGLGLALFAERPRAAPRPAALPPTDLLEITVDDPVATAVVAAPRAASSVDEPHASEETRHRERGGRPGAQPPTVIGNAVVGPEEGESASDGGAPEAPQGPERDDALRPRLSLEQLGLGAARHFEHVESAADDLAREQKLALERSLVAPGYEADRKRGLGIGGPIATALESAARTSISPPTGRAKFTAVTNGSGAIESLSLASCNGDAQDWASVAKAAMATLSADGRTIRDRRRGVVVTLEIDSRVTLPSGTDPGVSLSVAGRPVTKGEGARSTKVEVVAPPKIVVENSDPTAGEPRVNPDPVSNDKLPTARLEMPIFSLHGDLSDLGARARRIVHARVVEEAPR